LERPIPKPAERAKQTYQGRAGYEYSQRGGQYAIYCAGHCIAECEDAEVAEWICENWNKPQPDSSSIPVQPFRSDEALLRDILFYSRSRADNHSKFDIALREACLKLQGFDPDVNAAKGLK
jgi:hypothetical protein